MAVKIAVYGTANLRQIENARKELDRLEAEARKASTGFKGSMSRLGSAATSTGAKIASGLAAAAVGKWLKGSIEVAKKAQESQDSFKNAVLATNGVVNNSKVAGEAAAKTTLDLNKATTGAALAHNLAQQALKKHGATSLEYKNAVNSAALADAKVRQYAQKNKEAQYALAHAVKRTSINWVDYEAKSKKVFAAQSEISAYSKGQLRDALTQLTTTTGDANKSLDLLQVTTDLARRKHIDLSTAAVQVGRAYNGNTTALKRMGIEMPKGAKGMEVIDMLQKRVAGSAKTYGDSAAGAQDKYKNSLKSLQSQVGTALLPSLTSLMKSLAGLAGRFQKLSPNTQNIIVKIGAVTAAVLLLMPYFDKLGKAMKGIYSASKTAVTGLMNLVKGLRGTATAAEGESLPAMAKVGKAIRSAASASKDFVKKLATQGIELVKSSAKWVWNAATIVANKVATTAASAATKAAAAAQWLLNAAMSANPLGIVVVAVIALIGAIVLLWKKNEAFRNALTKAWTAIKNAATKVWTALVGAFKKWGVYIVAALLGPIALLVVVIAKHWNSIKSGAMKAWNAVVAFFKSAPGRITKALGNLGSLLLNVGRDIVNGLKNGITNAWSSLVAKVKGLTNALPSVVKKILGIRSPSRVFMTIGEQVGQGMEVGILKTKKNIEAATGRVAATAIAGVKRYQEQVKNLRSRTTEIMGSWGVGELVKPETVTSASLVAGQQSQATATASFLASINKLKKTKLAPAVISALMAAGPATSGAQATAFAGMTPDQVKQYNAAYYGQKRSAGQLAEGQLGKVKPPKNITIHSGALKVDIHIAGNASEHDVNAAVSKAFTKLTRELKAK